MKRDVTLRRITPRCVFAGKLLLKKSAGKVWKFFSSFQVNFELVEMMYDIKYYHLCIHTGLQ